MLCTAAKSGRMEIFMYEKATKDLMEFISKSADAFHAIDTVRKILEDDGFEELCECGEWNIKNGGKYYVTRNLSSLIAFKIPNGEYSGMMIAASHSDSPSYKIKPVPEVMIEGKYTSINVEGYGGMIASTWLDRPLGVSGRITVRTNGGISSKLVKIDEDFLTIPNIAIHMERDLNSGHEFNPAKDMLPIAGAGCESGVFMRRIAEAAGVFEDNIISHDLFLYNRMPGSIWGLNREFFSVGRIDDLQCAYSSLIGFMESCDTESIQMCCIFDNEEVGSGTKQGACSTFMTDVLYRINSSLGFGDDKLMRAAASSFMVSADNAHALHPNHTDKADKTSRPVPNGGVVIKYNANQKYTTDSVSDAIFRQICEKAGVPCQTYTNRSDIAGGSTLGNLANQKLSVNTVDIGAAQLAMHSSYETGGIKDTLYLIKAMREFFSTEIKAVADGRYIIESRRDAENC